MHNMLNVNLERQESRNCPHRDFYNVRKVDNNVYHAGCMNRKQLLRFIKSRIERCPHAVVMEENGEDITLSQVVENLDIKPKELSIDTLDMSPRQVNFHRFDRFTARYNPLEMSKLHSIFLKTDNYMKGRFLAEITEEVFHDLDSSKYQNAEFSLSIHGMNKDEWDNMASWVCQKNLQANHIKWMIRTLRMYPIFRKANMISSFQEMIENIFQPLFEVTIDPSTHPELHLFLKLVVGFDCVGDDSIPDKKRKRYPKPSDWTTEENPPFILYTYYFYGNLYVLNKLREERGMNTFTWRPHAGVSGDIEHLGVSFMVADSISHGIALKRSTVLQYLYYLSQIGIAMSPLSNNVLFLEYQNNPFPRFFTRGLRVTLCTENPLMIHYTKEPLVEEYAVAAQLYKLSSIDMCEIARNSVLMSGFSHATKCHWIGSNYKERGPKGNCIDKTNVPNIRLLFREEMLQQEEDMLLGLPVTNPIYNLAPDIKKEASGRRRSLTELDFVSPMENEFETETSTKVLEHEPDVNNEILMLQPKLIQSGSTWSSELLSSLRKGAPTVAFGIMTGVILMKISESSKPKSGKSDQT
jgi:AMP deaminase